MDKMRSLVKNILVFYRYDCCRPYAVSFFLTLIIYGFDFLVIQKGIPGGGQLKKGIVFGLCVWAVGMLPGMFAPYAFMTVATTVVIYWTILGFIKTPLEGMIIATIYGE